MCRNSCACREPGRWSRRGTPSTLCLQWCWGKLPSVCAYAVLQAVGGNATPPSSVQLTLPCTRRHQTLGLQAAAAGGLCRLPQPAVCGPYSSIRPCILCPGSHLCGAGKLRCRASTGAWRTMQFAFQLVQRPCSMLAVRHPRCRSAHRDPLKSRGHLLLDMCSWCWKCWRAMSSAAGAPLNLLDKLSRHACCDCAQMSGQVPRRFPVRSACCTCISGPLSLTHAETPVNRCAPSALVCPPLPQHGL